MSKKRDLRGFCETRVRHSRNHGKIRALQCASGAGRGCIEIADDRRRRHGGDGAQDVCSRYIGVRDVAGARDVDGGGVQRVHSCSPRLSVGSIGLHQYHFYFRLVRAWIEYTDIGRRRVSRKKRDQETGGQFGRKYKIKWSRTLELIGRNRQLDGAVHDNAP